ncbi:solute carrier family 45 member 4-like [Brienomyrus brachyistius]|uniref:solute carrier family 45 member 4-like n=1 Tax=Brienomyrus brachyistius TaxID=42636 RepID=UPI0020B351C2|nr:solute carrier family 45 member 4-like [Brienomyrus brachyistius]XP_048882645.1 solute carrier family 45 member 4-like [Brienomyrus brachyistius]
MSSQKSASDSLEAQGERTVLVKGFSTGQESDEHIPMWQWVMHGAITFGREFCYAMETALVTPLLLQIGLPDQFYSLTWFLSPILGLIITPLLGSASDGCTCRWGRRRPFVLALCLGILVGLALFFNGSLIGLSVGDVPNHQLTGLILTVLGVVILDFCLDGSDGPIRAYLLDVADTEEQDIALNTHAFSGGLGGALGYIIGGVDWTTTFWALAFKAREQILFFFAAIFLTISVVLHLFSIKERRWSQQPENEKDSMSPAEVPQLDVFHGDEPHQPCRDGCSERDVPRFLIRSKSDSALTTADATLHLDRLSVFHQEIELSIFRDQRFSDQGICNQPGSNEDNQEKLTRSPSWQESQEKSMVRTEEAKAKPSTREPDLKHSPGSHALRGNVGLTPSHAMRPRCHTLYRQTSFTLSCHCRAGGSIRHARAGMPVKLSRSVNDICEPRSRPRLWSGRRTLSSASSAESEEQEEPETSVRLIWLSMLTMPSALRRLCLCHLLTWFSLTAQAVFYTDFMGQVVYDGDPSATANSTSLLDYRQGVQMGCWGLAIYAATAAVCSALLQKFLDLFDLSIKIIYILGTLGFSIGTATMAIFPNVYVSMAMISTMGILSMSMSYSPYALLGQYHELNEYLRHSPGKSKRGFGIDCAILTCQVYVAQILVASALGSVVDAIDSVRVIPIVASGASFLAFLTSTFLVIYPDLDDEQVEALAPGEANSREHVDMPHWTSETQAA